MRKVSEPEQKIIASLVTSGQSIEFIKEKYNVAERQINSYVKKYSDDESFFVTPTKNDITNNEKANSNLLTEEYIMEHHVKLRNRTGVKVEKSTDLIKRQLKIPYIQLYTNNHKFFDVRFVEKERCKWGKTEEASSNIIYVYPNSEAFDKGKLEYNLDRKLYVDPKIVQKYGFKSYVENSRSSFKVTSPLKIFKKDLLKTINEGTLNLNEVLKRNKLSSKKSRSEKFNKWLEENNYI